MKQTTDFSRIISGAMTWGSWGKKLSKKEMIEVMQHGIACGITTFDHADIYGSYSTEADFGQAFVEKVTFHPYCGLQASLTHFGSLFLKL